MIYLSVYVSGISFNLPYFSSARAAIKLAQAGVLLYFFLVRKDRRKRAGGRCAWGGRVARGNVKWGKFRAVLKIYFHLEASMHENRIMYCARCNSFVEIIWYFMRLILWRNIIWTTNSFRLLLPYLKAFIIFKDLSHKILLYGEVITFKIGKCHKGWYKFMG